MTTSSDKVIKAEKLPEHGSCFICGTQNPKNMGLIWYAIKNPKKILVFSEFQFTLAEQGPPEHVHGGASAAVIDEAMGAAVWQSGLKVVLANMNLNYHLPVPIHVPVRVEGWLERFEGKKAYAQGHILLPDGRSAVSGTGLFIHAPQLFTFDYYG